MGRIEQKEGNRRREQEQGNSRKETGGSEQVEKRKGES